MKTETEDPVKDIFVEYEESMKNSTTSEIETSTINTFSKQEDSFRKKNEKAMADGYGIITSYIVDKDNGIIKQVLRLETTLERNDRLEKEAKDELDEITKNYIDRISSRINTLKLTNYKLIIEVESNTIELTVEDTTDQFLEEVGGTSICNTEVYQSLISRID